MIQSNEAHLFSKPRVHVLQYPGVTLIYFGDSEVYERCVIAVKEQRRSHAPEVGVGEP